MAYAAKNYGCDVTGLTLAQSGAKFGNERIKANGVSESQARILCLDYRDMPTEKKFTKIVSLEMAEVRRFSCRCGLDRSRDRLNLFALLPPARRCLEILGLLEAGLRSFRRQRNLRLPSSWPQTSLAIRRSRLGALRPLEPQT